MKPCDSVLESLLGCCTDDLPFIRNSNVPSLVAVAVTVPKAIDQKGGILASVIDNAGHGDNAPVYAKCRLKFGGMVFEGQQGLFKFIYRLWNVQSQKIKPFFIDKTHFADSLDCRFL